jgi:hypothetical protein
MQNSTLDRFLAQAGFAVAERDGGWQKEPFEPSSPEIITIARVDGDRASRSSSISIAAIPWLRTSGGAVDGTP